MASKGEYYFTHRNLVKFVCTLLSHKISNIGVRMLTMDLEEFLGAVWLPYIRGFQTAHELGTEEDECGAAGSDYTKVFFDEEKFKNFITALRRSVFISYGEEWKRDIKYFRGDVFWSDDLWMFWYMILGECFHVQLKYSRVLIEMLPYYYLAKMTSENRDKINWEYMRPIPEWDMYENKMEGIHFCRTGVVIDTEYPNNQLGLYNVDEHPLPGGIRWNKNTGKPDDYVHVNKVKWLTIADKVSEMEDTSDEEVPSSQEKYMKMDKNKKEQLKEKKGEEQPNKKRKLNLSNMALEKQKMELGRFFRMEEEPINIKLNELDEGREYHVHEAVRVNSNSSKFAKKKDEHGNDMDDFKVIICDGDNNLYGCFANTQLTKLFNRWHNTKKYSMKPEHNISLTISAIQEVRNGKMCVCKMAINDDIKCFAR